MKNAKLNNESKKNNIVHLDAFRGQKSDQLPEYEESNINENFGWFSESSELDDEYEFLRYGYLGDNFW
jgi:hypothetical protein